MADTGIAGRSLVVRLVFSVAVATVWASSPRAQACDGNGTPKAKCCGAAAPAAVALPRSGAALATAPAQATGAGDSIRAEIARAPQARARGTTLDRTPAPDVAASVGIPDRAAPVAVFYSEGEGGEGDRETPEAVWAQLAGDKELEAELTARLAALEAQLSALQGQLDTLSAQLADAHGRHGGTPPPGVGHGGAGGARFERQPLPGHPAPMPPMMPAMPVMPSHPDVPLFPPMPPMPSWAGGDDDAMEAYREAMEEYRETAEEWAEEYREHYDEWRERHGASYERMRDQYREWADQWRGEQQELSEQWRAEVERWKERAHESADQWRERLERLNGDGRLLREDVQRRVRDATDTAQQRVREELDAARRRTERTRDRAPRGEGTAGRVVFPVVGDCADRLFELLAPATVKPVVSREGKHIAVTGSREELQAIEAGLQLLAWIDRDEVFERMRQGDAESRVYQVGGERAEQLFQMLAPDDVKVVVSRAENDAVGVSGTPREHEVLAGLLAVLGWDAESGAPRDSARLLEKEMAVKEKAAKEDRAAREKREKVRKNPDGAVFAPRADAAPRDAALPRTPVPSRRGTSAAGGERMGQAYEMTDGDHADALYELLAPAEVKVIVSRSGDTIAIQGTGEEHATLESALQLLGWIERDEVFERMRQGDSVPCVYRLGPEHADAVYDMLAPDDVKVFVSRSGVDAVSVNATQQEHEVLDRFFSLLNWNVVR